MTTTTTQLDQTTVTTSKQFSLNLSDAGKGLLMAVAGAVLAAIQTSLDAGQVTFNWKVISMTAISAGTAYLLKNFFTPSKTIVIPEVKTASVILPETPAEDGKVIPLSTDDPKKTS